MKILPLPSNAIPRGKCNGVVVALQRGRVGAAAKRGRVHQVSDEILDEVFGAEGAFHTASAFRQGFDPADAVGSHVPVGVAEAPDVVFDKGFASLTLALRGGVLCRDGAVAVKSRRFSAL